MHTLTPKERLLAAAKKQQVDRPPCICPGGMMNMMFRDIMEQSNCLWPEAHVDPEKWQVLPLVYMKREVLKITGCPFV